MDRVIGNFTKQSGKDFPLDCETLEALQGNTTMLGLLGNIAGDKVVLSGCEVQGDGSQRGEGYVYLKTRDYPGGEVLRWEGGTTSYGMFVRHRDISVSANGNNYPKAYSMRSLAPGIGEENYEWDDFVELRNIRELMSDVSRLESELAGMSGPPLGIVEMWAGSVLPEGYALCDGHQLKQADYPELYSAIGSVFNTAISASGNQYTTESGYFRLPDLRGRFIVGHHDSDVDYQTKGNAGGEKRHALTAEELPGHQHEVKDYVQKPNGNGEIYAGTVSIGETQLTAGGDQLGSNVMKRSQTDTGGDGWLQWIQHSTEAEKKRATSHENRPPYYVLAYIMRVK